MFAISANGLTTSLHTLAKLLFPYEQFGWASV